MKGDAMSAHVSIAIEGMHCQNCVTSVFKKLSAIPGIDTVEVNLEKHEAIITGSEISIDAVRNAIEELGFDAGEAKDLKK